MKLLWCHILFLFIGLAPTLAGNGESKKTWQFTKDFSGTVSTGDWTYSYSSLDRPEKRIPLDRWEKTTQSWSHAGQSPRIWSDGRMTGRNRIPNQFPGELAVVEWTAPTSGTYRIVCPFQRVHPAGGDGFIITVLKESRWGITTEVLKHHFIPGKIDTPKLEVLLDLEEKDRLLFTHFCGDDAGFDEVRFDPVIVLTSIAQPESLRFILPLAEGKIEVDLKKPFAPLTLKYNGQSLNLIENLGPALIRNGKPLSPGKYHLDLFRYSFDPKAQRLFAVYRIPEFPAPTYYWLTFETQGPTIHISMEMRDPVAQEVWPGTLTAPNDFKPFPVTRRLRESWEANEVQPAFRHRRGQFWIYGRWNLEDSDSFDGGDGCVAPSLWAYQIAPRTGYPAYAFGLRRCVREKLTIGIAKNLWTAVGPSPNLPSEYARELSESMFVDLWGGSSVQKRRFLERLARQTAGTIRFYTIVQTWAAGGFDGINPDAFWPNRLPPGEAYGTEEDLKNLVAAARKYGRVGLRTNYNYLVPEKSPSVKEGLIKGILLQAVPEKGNVMPDQLRVYQASSRYDWTRLARFQETDIHTTFGTNTQFVDQAASFGGAGFLQDLTPNAVGAGVGRRDVEVIRQFCRLVKAIHHGPLSSETLNGETVIGYWCDTGDYGIFDGRHRWISPEYKLHRLHQLSTFHGMGLAYRFFDYPQSFQNGADWLGGGHGRYWGQSPHDPYEGIDSYRAMTVLFGNGAYYYSCADFLPAAKSHEEQPFTEAMTVGVLQRYYALQPVKTVCYFWKDKWQTLNELMEDDQINFHANKDDCPAFKTVRGEYANGLTVTVNRDEKPVKVTPAPGLKLTLPKDGWVGSNSDGTLLVYSGIGPLAEHRIDFALDKSRGIRFLNPRGKTVEGTNRPTLWLHDQKQEY